MDYIEFFQDDGGRWHWRRAAFDGTWVSDPSVGFEKYAEVLESAVRANGHLRPYVGDPDRAWVVDP